MWDLATIKHMNSKEQVDLARRKARAMNGVSYSGTENSIPTTKPFLYSSEGRLLASSQVSDLEFAKREIARGVGKLEYISESKIRKPTHGGRSN